MELKEGMYVRTEDGEISKIKWITLQRWEGLENTIEASFILENNECLEYPRDNFNASDNIIDLIEVGDYVNGKEVMAISKFKDGSRYIEFDEGRYLCKNYQIKSVVTKEMFYLVKYEVE